MGFPPQQSRRWRRTDARAGSADGLQDAADANSARVHRLLEGWDGRKRARARADGRTKGQGVAACAALLRRLQTQQTQLGCFASESSNQKGADAKLQRPQE